MTSVFSWQNSISLRPASFCTPRTNLPVTPGVSWLHTFAFQTPIMKRTSQLQYFGHLMQRVDSLERPWCWGGLGAGGEGDDRGWDSCMASPTRWTWVWVNSGSWWWTGRPGVLWFMGSQRVGHDWATELNWTELNYTENKNWDLDYDLLTYVLLPHPISFLCLFFC